MLNTSRPEIRYPARLRIIYFILHEPTCRRALRVLTGKVEPEVVDLQLRVKVQCLHDSPEPSIHAVDEKQTYLSSHVLLCFLSIL